MKNRANNNFFLKRFISISDDQGPIVAAAADDWILFLVRLLLLLQISEWYKGKKRLKSKMEIDPATQV